MFFDLFSASILVLVTLASAQTELPTATSASSVPSFEHNAECSCYAQLPAGRLSTAQLLGDLLNHSPKPEKCDRQGMADCVTFCNDKIAHVSNDFDLNVPPKTKEGLTIPLGQYICNVLGRDVQPRNLRLYAKLECHTRNGFSTSTSTQISTTGMVSKQGLECKDGKFVPHE